MCRSIKILRKPDGLSTDEDIKAASLQFIRKVSGFRHPSKINEQVFTTAVESTAVIVKNLLLNLKKLEKNNQIEIENYIIRNLLEGNPSTMAPASDSTRTTEFLRNFLFCKNIELNYSLKAFDSILDSNKSKRIYM